MSGPPAAEGLRTAIAEPGLARRLRRRLQLGAGALVLGVAALVTALVGYRVLDQDYLARQSLLTVHPGSILRVVDTSADGDSGVAEVTFVLDGVRRSVNVHVGNVHRWNVDEQVDVLEDPATGLVTLPGENYRPEWVDDGAFLLGGFGFVLAAVGTVTVSRTLRRRHRLSRTHWWRTPALFVSTQSGESTVHYAYLPEWTPDRLWKCDRGTPGPGPTPVDGAGDGAGIVLRLPGSDRLVLGRPVPFGRPERMEVVASALLDATSAVRVRDARGAESVYEVLRPTAAEVVAALTPGTTVTVRRGHRHVAVVCAGADELLSFAVPLSSGAVRKRAPALAVRS